jgi:hypothetical protein
MKESPADIILALSHGDTRLWRQQVGTFRALHSDHLVRVGVPGMSDITGLTSRIITADMVGQRIAQFVAIECKAPGSRASDSDKARRIRQGAFIDTVNRLGGIAGIARSVDEARGLLGL